MFADSNPELGADEATLLPGVSVVVLVFNSAETLRELVDEVTQAIRHISRPFENVIVDNGSIDAGWGRGCCGRLPINANRSRHRIAEVA